MFAVIGTVSRVVVTPRQGKAPRVDVFVQSPTEVIKVLASVDGFRKNPVRLGQDVVIVVRSMPGDRPGSQPFYFYESAHDLPEVLSASIAGDESSAALDALLAGGAVVPSQSVEEEIAKLVAPAPVRPVAGPPPVQESANGAKPAVAAR